MSGVEIRITRDRSRCVLCGGPNECVMARPSGDAPAARGASPPDESTASEPCWCVDRVFPGGLTQAAIESDGGASCICRSCLEGSEP
jgi:hypothetical protein